MQLFKHNKVEEKSSNQDLLKEEFESIKNKEVEKATTKVVNFYYHSSCGCGGTSTKKYHATVPIDNPIKDGDTIDFYDDANRNPDLWNADWKEGWV